MMIAKPYGRVKVREDLTRLRSRLMFAEMNRADKLDLRLGWFYSLRQRVRRSLGL